MHRGRVNFKKNEDRLRLSGVDRGRGDELLLGNANLRESS